MCPLQTWGFLETIWGTITAGSFLGFLSWCPFVLLWGSALEGRMVSWGPSSVWWTGRPGVLWFMGSQRVRHDWVTELNWTDLSVWALRSPLWHPVGFAPLLTLENSVLTLKFSMNSINWCTVLSDVVYLKKSWNFLYLLRYFQSILFVGPGITFQTNP